MQIWFNLFNHCGYITEGQLSVEKHIPLAHWYKPDLNAQPGGLQYSVVTNAQSEHPTTTINTAKRYSWQNNCIFVQ